MGVEIERKYLILQGKWDNLVKPEGLFFRQGYLLTDPKKTIRVRLTKENAFLTIKGLSVGASRPEFEYEIPKDEAKELLDNFAVAEIEKIRYKITFDNKVWEIDEFLGDNLGLIIAEIELNNEAEKFDLPNFIGEEVTGEEKYYNSSLSFIHLRIGNCLVKLLFKKDFLQFGLNLPGLTAGTVLTLIQLSIINYSIIH